MLPLGLSFRLNHLLRLNFAHLELLFGLGEFLLQLLDLGEHFLPLILVVLPDLLIPKDGFLHLGPIFVLLLLVGSRAERPVPVLKALYLDALLLEQSTKP